MRIILINMPKTNAFTEEQETVAKIANALSHPVRIAILQLLSSQSCCYHGDMAEELPIARSTLSQHLTVLKEAGLIQGDVHPPKVKYCINQENFKKARHVLLSFFDKEMDTVFSKEGLILCS